MNRTPKAFVEEFQRRNGLEDDGVAGNDTNAALDRVLPLKAQPIEKPAPAIISSSGEKADERSEKVISTLHPRLHDKARQLVQDAASKGIKIKIISGLRTYDEQNSLFAQGRSSSGKIVTNARGGYSNHNFGVAFDVGVFSSDGSKYIDESPSYKIVGQLGKALGFEWGGDWTTIQDQPHFQLRPAWAKGMKEGEMLAEMRARKASSQGVF